MVKSQSLGPSVKNILLVVLSRCRNELLRTCECVWCSEVESGVLPMALDGIDVFLVLYLGLWPLPYLRRALIIKANFPAHTTKYVK